MSVATSGTLPVVDSVGLLLPPAVTLRRNGNENARRKLLEDVALHVAAKRKIVKSSFFNFNYGYSLLLV